MYAAGPAPQGVSGSKQEARKEKNEKEETKKEKKNVCFDKIKFVVIAKCQALQLERGEH